MTAPVLYLKLDSLMRGLPEMGTVPTVANSINISWQWPIQSTDVTRTADAKFGYCMRFNGTTSNILLPTLTCPSEFTLSVWVKKDSSLATTGDVTLVEFGLSAPCLGLTNLVPKLFNTTITGTSTAAALGANWTHLALTQDSSGSKLYVDGTLVTSASRAPTSGYGLSIGQMGNTRYFKGDMAQLWLFDGVLPAATITRLKNEYRAVTPKLYLPLDTIVNGKTPIVSPDKTALSRQTYEAEFSNISLRSMGWASVNLTNAQIRFPNFTLEQQFTIAAWLWPMSHGLTTPTHIMGHKGKGPKLVQKGQNLVLMNGSTEIITSSSAALYGIHHFAATSEAVTTQQTTTYTVKLYIDGRMMGSTSLTNWGTGSEFVIGNSQTDAGFDGYISDVVVFDQALSEDMLQFTMFGKSAAP